MNRETLLNQLPSKKLVYTPTEKFVAYFGALAFLLGILYTAFGPVVYIKNPWTPYSPMYVLAFLIVYTLAYQAWLILKYLNGVNVKQRYVTSLKTVPLSVLKDIAYLEDGSLNRTTHLLIRDYYSNEKKYQDLGYERPDYGNIVEGQAGMRLAESLEKIRQSREQELRVAKDTLILLAKLPKEAMSDEARNIVLDGLGKVEPDWVVVHKS